MAQLNEIWATLQSYQRQKSATDKIKEHAELVQLSVLVCQQLTRGQLKRFLSTKSAKRILQEQTNVN